MLLIRKTEFVAEGNRRRTIKTLIMLHLNTKKIKITIFAIAMTVAFCQTNAQQQLFATLNHNDTITAYYGANALQQAHDAAVKGDVITLSSGTFNGVTITKMITIRGAGMFTNTEKGTLPTIINGSSTIYNPSGSTSRDSIHHLSIEGIYFISGVYCVSSSSIYYNNSITLYDACFLKCRFAYFYGNTEKFRDAVFVNCIFDDASFISYSRFTNCIILNESAQYSNWCIFNSTLLNCYVTTCKPANSGYNTNIYFNCIVYYKNSNATGNLSSINSYNCIGIMSNGNSLFATPILNDCHNMNSLSSVFKTFNGTYNNGETFELQDSIVNNYRSTDSTQIGIYGGIVPYDPTVGNPKIRRCNVGLRSTADGKLNVDIEVVP